MHDDLSGSEPAAAPGAPPVTARRLETRERLLDAAAGVFSESGLRGASVEAICARAGFSRGAFYSNFSTKEELFLSLLEREFETRARDLEAKATEIEPLLRAHEGDLSHDEAARYISAFFSPQADAIGWFVLETEFLLLAMRDPSIAPGHEQFMARFYANIAQAVEQVLAAAGRRFSFPTERALPVLSSVYEEALRTSALAGDQSDRIFDDLGVRMAEVIFAITEPREI